MYQMEIERLAEMLGQADAVVIAASNGFDIADGYNQFACDETFLRTFGDLHRDYGLMSILQGLMVHRPSARERWRFLARLIEYGYRAYAPSPVMRALDEATRDTPRFVVTCNCNSRFLKAGFSSDGLLETEGSFARLRCTASCSRETYDALQMIDIAAGDLPRCPRCGAVLDVAVDDTGRIGALEPFAAQRARMRAFLDGHASDRTLVLELGVGQGNRAIKAPLMAWAERAPGTRYVVVNRDEPVLPELPENRAVGIRGDLARVLADLGTVQNR